MLIWHGLVALEDLLRTLLGGMFKWAHVATSWGVVMHLSLPGAVHNTPILQGLDSARRFIRLSAPFHKARHRA